MAPTAQPDLRMYRRDVADTARGFKVQLRHVFRKMPLVLFNGVQFSPLNKRFFALGPQFVLVARKPE